MEYIEKAKKLIRDKWFKDHQIKSIHGEDGFQRIIWGKEGTGMYQIIYTLSGNMIYITGDVGTAAYSLTCQATLANIASHELWYFTDKLIATERKKWDFDYQVAQKEIEECFLDWCDVDSVGDLPEEEKELYKELIQATLEWDDPDTFANQGVWTIYHATNVDWFDSEIADSVATSGNQLSNTHISYWVGLQMVIEQLKEKELQSA